MKTKLKSIDCVAFLPKRTVVKISVVKKGGMVKGSFLDVEVSAKTIEEFQQKIFAVSLLNSVKTTGYKLETFRTHKGLKNIEQKEIDKAADEIGIEIKAVYRYEDVLPILKQLRKSIIGAVGWKIENGLQIFIKPS